MKKSSRPNEASRRLSGYRGRAMPVAMLLILVVLISVASGAYAGASFLAQQAPNVTVTTTIYTTTTSWTTSTMWSTVTAVVQGVLTTVQYTTSTSTVTVISGASGRTPKTITANGNARMNTAQSVFGGASGLFSGNGAYLSTPDSADWAFGSGDFTIDFWVRFNTLPASGAVAAMYEQRVSDSSRFGFWLYNSAGTMRWAVYLGGTGWILQVNAIISTGTWYHVALVRGGNSWYVFQNGIQVGSTVANSASIPDLAAPVWIGAHDVGLVTRSFFDGWMDEYRISKGVARWTSNFSPSTSPYTDDSNTVLLLHMDGADASSTFIDG